MSRRQGIGFADRLSDAVSVTIDGRVRNCRMVDIPSSIREGNVVQSSDLRFPQNAVEFVERTGITGVRTIWTFDSLAVGPIPEGTIIPSHIDPGTELAVFGVSSSEPTSHAEGSPFYVGDVGIIVGANGDNNSRARIHTGSGGDPSIGDFVVSFIVYAVVELRAPIDQSLFISRFSEITSRGWFLKTDPGGNLVVEVHGSTGFTAVSISFSPPANEIFPVVICGNLDKTPWQIQLGTTTVEASASIESIGTLDDNDPSNLLSFGFSGDGVNGGQVVKVHYASVVMTEDELEDFSPMTFLGNLGWTTEA